MNIAILGTGRVGGNLGKALAAKGHSIMFGTRDPHTDKVQTLLASIGENASTGSIADAVAFGEVVAIATPAGAVDDLIKAGEHWHGKIIIDATNQIGADDPTSVAERIAAKASGARVVKAFNTIGAEHYSNPQFNGESASMFICGDDLEANEIVGDLVQSLGFDLVNVGYLRNARLLESLAALWVTMARNDSRDIAFRLLRK